MAGQFSLCRTVPPIRPATRLHAVTHEPTTAGGNLLNTRGHPKLLICANTMEQTNDRFGEAALRRQEAPDRLQRAARNFPMPSESNFFGPSHPFPNVGHINGRGSCRGRGNAGNARPRLFSSDRNYREILTFRPFPVRPPRSSALCAGLAANPPRKPANSSRHPTESLPLRALS